MPFFKYLLLIIGLFLLSGTYMLKGNNENKINKKVANSAEEICPVKVGEKIPDVTLTTTNGKAFNLTDAVKQKPTLLIYYRGGWCPYCNMHLSELQSIEDELVAMGYQILAISFDRFEKLDESIEKHQLQYTLLSDNDAEAAKAFGLVFQVSDEYIGKLKKHDMDLEEASGKTHHLLPVPAAFIVDTNGVIKFEYINPNYKVRVDPDVILAAAKAELKPES